MTPWVRSAVDLVPERRRLARRVDVVATPPATRTPDRPGPAWLCINRGHVYAAGDDSCVYCNGVD